MSIPAPPAARLLALVLPLLASGPASGQWLAQETGVVHPDSNWPSQEDYGCAVAVDGDTAVVGTSPPMSYYSPAFVRVYVQAGGAWVEQGELKPSTSSVYSEFGAAVDLQGDTLVVGAPGDSRAHVFTRQAGVWSEQAVLSGGGAGARFGCAVALDGDTIAVGAELGGASKPGQAFVFVRSGTGWSQQGVLMAGNASGGDLFGSSLALSGDTLLVGAPHQDQGANNRGTAYVFDRSGSSWAQTVKLRAGDGKLNDEFGIAVALEGNTAVVGAHLRDLGTMQDVGAAYVFQNLSGTWTELVTLTPGNAGGGDEFGAALALHAGTLAVGSEGDDHAAGTDAGSIHVLVGSGASWSEQAQLFASDGQAGARFGRAVDVSGDRIVAGSEFDQLLFDTGRAYGFVRSANSWSEDLAASSPAEALVRSFGWALDMDGDTLLVSDPAAWTVQGSSAGSAWIFVLGPAGWSQQAWLHDDLGGAGDGFGHALALDADTAVIGSLRGDGGGVVDAGSALVHVRSGGVWSLEQELVPSSLAAGDEYGTALAVDGDRIVVGAPGGDIGGLIDSGAVFVFERSAGVWSQVAELSASDKVAGDHFGAAVALDGSTLVVGAESADGPGPASGAVYVFALSGGTWTQQARLAPDPSPGARFGAALALEGEYLLVGAPRSVMDEGPVGAAFFFRREENSFGPAVRASVADPRPYDDFGAALALDGDVALIGAPGQGPVDAGRAYVFLREGSSWQEALGFASASTDDGDAFGHGVDIAGTRMVAGAVELHFELQPAGAEGAPGLVHAFELSPPPPVSYCTAGTSGSGCQALLSSSGVPSVSAGSGFTVAASGVEGSKAGSFYYGTSGAQASPWGVGTSFQCVAPPLVRTGLLFGSGTGGACDGAFALDLNAHWSAGPVTAPGAGAVVQVQLWYRDPQNTSGQPTSLSDALELTVAP